MKAVILAAGVGSRLMPLTRNTPKSLIDVGGGFTLLERQLHSLGKNGIHDIVLVTGYKSRQIEAKVHDYEDFNFSVIYNPFYKLSNNLPSAWLGLKDLEPPVLLVNGDDLFKPSVVETLLASKQEITMMISRKDSFDDDDMKVCTQDGQIMDVGKDIPPERANGESIGMMLCRGNGLQTFQESLLELVRVEENLQLFYLAAMRRLMHDGTRIHFAECSTDDWAEVDFHPDLEVVRQDVLSDLPAWD